MSTAVTFNHQERRQIERRVINVDRRSTERRKATHRSETLQQSAGKKNVALTLFLHVFAAVLGFAVLYLTGLFQEASSTIAQTILAVTIVFIYMIAVRRAFYF